MSTPTIPTLERGNVYFNNTSVVSDAHTPAHSVPSATPTASENTPQSQALLRQINRFVQHDIFKTLAPEKIEMTFARFIVKIKKLEMQEKANPSLIEAQATIQAHQASTAVMQTPPKSDLLLKQIETFIQGPNISSWTQEKIKNLFNRFSTKIQALETAEGPNAFLIIARKYIEDHQETAIKKGKLTVECDSPKSSLRFPSPLFSSSSSSSSTTSATTSAPVKEIAHNPPTEEDKLYDEILLSLQNPLVKALSCTDMEELLKGYETRLSQLEKRPDDPSFGFKIKLLIEKHRVENTNRHIIHLAPSSRPIVNPHLIDVVGQLDHMCKILVEEHPPLTTVTTALVKLNKQVPLHIDKKRIMVPAGALVLYHLSMIHFAKSRSLPILKPGYAMKAFENKDGCTATLKERIRALLRAATDISLQAYINAAKEHQEPLVDQCKGIIRSCYPLLYAVGDAIPELQNFGQGKKTVEQCLEYAQEIRVKLKAQWNLV